MAVDRLHVQHEQHVTPPSRRSSPGLRPAALARGRRRLRRGGVAAEDLAVAMIEATALVQLTLGADRGRGRGPETVQGSGGARPICSYGP